MFSPFERAFKAVRSRVTARTIAFILPYAPGVGQPDYFDRTFENYVKEGYKRNEIIYACINVTTNTASSVALLTHDAATDKPIKEHPLQQLLRRPNSLMTEYDFWTWTLMYQMLAGVAYWQKIRDRGGRVVELWPVRPDYIRPQTENDKGLTGYRVQISGVVQEEIEQRDMLVFPLPDPMNIFNHMSPIEVIARTTDVDNSLTDLLKLMMQRGAVPMGILSSKLRLTDDAIADIRRRWEERYAGYANWTTPAVLDSDATYQKTGMALNEMQFMDIDGRTETRICMVYQVPPIIVGTTKGIDRGTYSNYESARKQWWEDSLSGKYKKLADVIQTQLAPDFDDSIVVKWDFSKVAALQEGRDARWTRATAAFKDGVITRNMALKEMGLPLVGKEGDVFVQQMTQTMVPNNPADDAATPDMGDTQQDDAATTEGKALAVLNAPVLDADAPVTETEAARIERMYQAIAKEVRVA